MPCFAMFVFQLWNRKDADKTLWSFILSGDDHLKFSIIRQIYYKVIKTHNFYVIMAMIIDSYLMCVCTLLGQFL